MSARAPGVFCAEQVVPRIETERLVLRGGHDQDLDRFAAMFADPEVMRHLGGPQSRFEAWRSLAMHTGHWLLHGYGHWSVERRSDAELLGRVGLWSPPDWPGVELGWRLMRHAWGQGYAAEAARASIAWAWSELDVKRLVSPIPPANTPSIALARRLGMTDVGTWKEHDPPLSLYALDRATRLG